MLKIIASAAYFALCHAAGFPVTPTALPPAVLSSPFGWARRPPAGGRGGRP